MKTWHVVVLLQALLFMSGCKFEPGEVTRTQADPAPTAFNVSVVVEKGNSLEVSLAGHDRKSRDLTYSVVTSPSHGTLSSVVSSKVVYTPNPTYFGTESFTYLVSNGDLSSNVGTVNILVNAAPTANNQTLSVNEGEFLAVDLTGSDPEGSALTYHVVSGGAGFTGTPPNLSYNSGDFYGTKTLTFQVKDGLILSNVATITISVKRKYDDKTEVLVRGAAEERIAAKAVDRTNQKFFFLIKNPTWKIKVFSGTSTTSRTVVALAGTLEEENFKGFSVQADGKFLISGNSGTDTLLRRYNTDGSLDTAFGLSGVATIGGNSGTYAPVVVAQADGTIVAQSVERGSVRLVLLNSAGVIVRDHFYFALVYAVDPYLYTDLGGGKFTRFTRALGSGAEIGTDGVVQGSGNLVGALGGYLYTNERTFNFPVTFYKYQWKRFDFQGVEDTAFTSAHPAYPSNETALGLGNRLVTLSGDIVDFSYTGFSYSAAYSGSTYNWPYSSYVEATQVNELWDSTVLHTDILGAHLVR